MAGGWPKHIRVDKDVVNLLSKRTYDSFPQGLREVISNAYDADATLVEVSIDPQADRITITDNGRGMTPYDFEYYLRIAAKTRQARTTSRFGRRRIGQFGIGFLSIFPFCAALEISSTTENSDIEFIARIDADTYTGPSASSVEVSDIPVRGTERREPALRRKHGTTVTLIGLTDLVKEYFQVRPGTSPKSIQSWPWLNRLRWELQQILPIGYAPGSALGQIFKDDGAMAMEVRLNGTKIHRNEIARSRILEASSAPVTLPSGIRLTYAIVTPWTTISPIEARGLQMRLKNVGIGMPVYFGLNIVGKLFAKLVWLGGEIHIHEGLEDELAIDRNNFTSSTRYSELSEFFLERLRALAYRVDKEHAAERDIEHFLHGQMQRAPANSKREAIENRIETLRETGYQVAISSEAPSADIRPVKVDSVQRQVTYYQNHPDLSDRIVVEGVQYDLQFADWDYRASDHPACLVEHGKITLNRSYPLFQDRHVGPMFQRIAALLEIGRRRFITAEELYRFILDRLPVELNGHYSDEVEKKP